MSNPRPAGTSSPHRSSLLSKGTSRLRNLMKRNTQLSGPSHLREKPQHPSTPNPGSPQVYLRVNHRFLVLFPLASADEPNPQPLPPLPGTTGNLNVIIADLGDLHQFAGDTVDWLITVARLIFEPWGTSSLYTFTTESLEWWLDREMEPSLWRPVLPGEQLRATIYEFVPNNDAFITLTKMSLRQARSVTTNTSIPRAAPFRNALLRRDQRCIITQQSLQRSLIASHLIPRRLGDAGVQSVFQRFIGSYTTVSKYDPRIGVLLSATLDTFVDAYELGFWNYGPDNYVVHSFLDSSVNIYGIEPLTANEPMCHGTRITLSVHGSSLNLPPVGVFNWHYIQCVLKRFATTDYQEFGNVHHCVRPFRTRDDDDDESDIDFEDPGNISNPPYPSYLLELSELRARQRLEEAERHNAIVAWNSGVSVN